MLNCSKQIGETEGWALSSETFSYCWPEREREREMHSKTLSAAPKLISLLKTPVFVSSSSHLHGHLLRQKGLGVWGRNQRRESMKSKIQKQPFQAKHHHLHTPPLVLKWFMDRRKKQNPPPQIGSWTHLTLSEKGRRRDLPNTFASGLGVLHKNKTNWNQAVYGAAIVEENSG